MRLALRILLGITFVISCAWLYKEPGFEPILAVISAISTFLGDMRDNNELSKLSFAQSSGRDSIVQEAGGNAQNSGRDSIVENSGNSTQIVDSYNSKKKIVNENDFEQHNYHGSIGIQAKKVYYLSPPTQDVKSVAISKLPYKTLGNLFVGREDTLRELHEHLSVKKESVILYGLGGIGKTRLAVEYALLFEKHYTVSLFVRADSPTVLRDSLAELANKSVLNLPEQDEEKQDDKKMAVLRWLQENPDWLLILDNADNSAAAQAVESMLPQLTVGRVIITSRLSKWSKQLYGMQIDVLAHEDATKFLLERTIIHRQKELDIVDNLEASALANDLGGLALALEQAGAYIEARNITLGEYRKRWKSNEKLVRAWFNEQLMQYPWSVAVTWQTSFIQLSEKGKEILNYLSWLSSEVMPRVAFEDITTDVEDGISDLANFSLLTFTDDKYAFNIHQLVQDVTRDQLSSVIKQQIFTHTLNWLNKKFTEDIGDTRTWSLREDLQPHALRLVELAEEFANPYPVSHILSQIGNMLRLKAQPHEAEALIRKAVEIDENDPGADGLIRTNSLNELGLILIETNRAKDAISVYNRLLPVEKARFGLRSESVSNLYNNLGQALAEIGNFRQAEHFLRDALGIRRSIPDIPLNLLATTVNSLAGVLYNIYMAEGEQPGQFNLVIEAFELAKEATELAKSYYGIDSVRYARYLNSKAVILRLIKGEKELKEVEDMYREVACIYENTYGLKHPIVAGTYNSLAYILGLMNNFTNSYDYFTRGLCIVIEYKKRTGYVDNSWRLLLKNYRKILIRAGKTSVEIDEILLPYIID